MALELHPYVGRGAFWTITKAEEPGRCSLSGQPIAASDPVYVTDHPALKSMRVLVSQYDRYVEQRGLAHDKATQH